jgi:pimeloyl-ACP methyl ester carboxylesterase
MYEESSLMPMSGGEFVEWLDRELEPLRQEITASPYYDAWCSGKLSKEQVFQIMSQWHAYLREISAILTAWVQRCPDAGETILIGCSAIFLAPFCSLPRILEDNPNARSVLEGRFGPLQEKHFRTANALEILEGLKKPTLIVQGTADESVPFAHGKLLYDKLQAIAQFRPVQDGNHHLTNVDRAPVITDIVEWLER